ANGTNQDTDREALDSEFQQLIEEIDRIGKDTQFNKMKVHHQKLYLHLS
ncbi:hypothetical protein P4519_06655, partial [Geobacillus stearothermophilus]|nr:hypothetical protein [Geobacillus stearothermophilus]